MAYHCSLPISGTEVCVGRFHEPGGCLGKFQALRGCPRQEYHTGLLGFQKFLGASLVLAACDKGMVLLFGEMMWHFSSP